MPGVGRWMADGHAVHGVVELRDGRGEGALRVLGAGSCGGTVLRGGRGAVVLRDGRRRRRRDRSRSRSGSLLLVHDLKLLLPPHRRLSDLVLGHVRCLNVPRIVAVDAVLVFGVVRIGSFVEQALGLVGPQRLAPVPRLAVLRVHLQELRGVMVPRDVEAAVLSRGVVRGWLPVFALFRRHPQRQLDRGLERHALGDVLPELHFDDAVVQGMIGRRKLLLPHAAALPVAEAPRERRGGRRGVVACGPCDGAAGLIQHAVCCCGGDVAEAGCVSNGCDALCCALTLIVTESERWAGCFVLCVMMCHERPLLLRCCVWR
mmetsp:Transcript_4149/g.11867  ORF Transcript_4149/g.11867 Transcript_4149/m.11867 type:complete len:317 (-) Transcript_4149:550-1500(-)